MEYHTFVELFKKFPSTLTQIAFGIGDISANIDLFPIMQYCRDNKIVPNITINGEGLTDDYADKLAHYCGAVAVSYYGDDICFNAVQKLTSLGMKQINIHALLCEETYDNCFQLMRKAKTDERLKDLNAIVFLWLKPKGDRNVFHKLTSLEKYKRLVNYGLDNNQRIGFDSCSANAFLKAISTRKFSERQRLSQLVEPCESTLFSYYIDVDGVGYPCSFCGDLPEYKGINVLKARNFLHDVWNAPETKRFREKNLNNCRNCVAYNLGVE
jgi:radical SAM protein with 4Fe4S-binding SPASM domain